MSFKQQVQQHFLQLLQGRIAEVQQHLAELKEMAGNETKSTAGDKYETALAMLQIEQAKAGEQLSTLQEQLAELNACATMGASANITKGSLVNTNKGYFYVSVALGKASICGNTTFAISPKSPLGIKLHGMKAGDEVSVNGNVYSIVAVD